MKIPNFLNLLLIIAFTGGSNLYASSAGAGAGAGSRLGRETVLIGDHTLEELKGLLTKGSVHVDVGARSKSKFTFWMNVILAQPNTHDAIEAANKNA